MKSCPFCGSDQLTITHWPAGKPYESEGFAVSCTDCNCTSAMTPTEDTAIEAWNRRKQ